MVENVIRERGHLYRQANVEIMKVWGESHTFTGPVFTIPCFHSNHHKSGWSQRLRYQHVPPEEMIVRAVFDTQMRHRGGYNVPVYLAKISARGKFEIPDLKEQELIDKALIQIPFSLTKSLKKAPMLLWNGSALALTPVPDKSIKDFVIFQASIALADIGKSEFEIAYETAGSSEINLFSMAKKSKLLIESDWGSPSFHGEYFPTKYDIKSGGFYTEWDINNLFVDARDAEQEIISANYFEKHDMFGVRFIELADTYQLVTRSAKYAVLFIGLTFMLYFLVEVLGGNKLHPIQYLFIGLSNCIFYLLLLSLSEHIHFDLAYIVSALISSLLITLYSKSVLQNSKKALLVFLVLTALYSYLFITLKSEGFALVSGSIGLFTIMAILMYLTRNTNWHALSQVEQK
jgi:inner membrane protein